MSPEQARGDNERVGQPADVFGLGAILCVILTGKPPYTGEDAPSTLRLASAGALAETYTRLETCGADPEWIALARWCLSASPDERPRDAGEVGAVVVQLRCDAEERLRRAEVDRARVEAKAAEARKRRLAQRALAATVLVLLCGAAAFAWWQDRQAIERQAERDRADAEKRTLALERQIEDERRQAAERGRLARNADALAALVGRAEEALRALDTEGAELSLREAQSRTEEGGGEAIAGRLGRCRTDLDVLKRLDAVHRFAWTPMDNQYPSNRLIVVAWQETFAAFGVLWGKTPAAEAAARIKESLVQGPLLLALDTALVYEPMRWTRLVLALADPDELRDKVRDAILAQTPLKVTELLSSANLAAQPSRFIAALGQMEALPVAQRHGMLEMAASQRPGELALLMPLAHCYPEDAGGLAERLRWFQAAVAVHPKNPAVVLGLGMTLCARGDLNGALAECTKATQLAPDLLAAHNNLGTVHDRRGELDAAIASYREAARLAPTSGIVYYNLGIAQVKKRDWDGAIASLKKAIDFGLAIAGAYDSLGQALQAKKDLTGAVTAYREALRLGPGNAGTHVNLGIALHDQGDLKGAIEEYQNAIRMDPKLAPAHFNLALAYKTNKDLRSAVACYREARRLNPTIPQIEYHLGTALARIGEAREGVAVLREAIRRDPKFAPAHHNLGVALVDAHDLEGALASLREAVRLEPANPAFTTSLAKLQAAMAKKPKDTAPPPKSVPKP